MNRVSFVILLSFCNYPELQKKHSNVLVLHVHYLTLKPKSRRKCILMFFSADDEDSGPLLSHGRKTLYHYIVNQSIFIFLLLHSISSTCWVFICEPLPFHSLRELIGQFSHCDLQKMTFLESYNKHHWNIYSGHPPAFLWKGAAWPHPPQWPERSPGLWQCPQSTSCSTPGRGWWRWTGPQRWRGRSKWDTPAGCWRCPETCSGSSPAGIKPRPQKLSPMVWMALHLKAFSSSIFLILGFVSLLFFPFLCSTFKFFL